MRYAYKFITSQEMQSVLELPAGLTKEDVEDDEKFDGYIQSHIMSAYHFCGTCRMAVRNKGGVLDRAAACMA